MGSNKKKPIIEGYLKKKKQGSSFKLFSKTTKRWFALDITSATFTYSNGKKVIPLRDIEALSTNDLDYDGKSKEPKEWEHYFKLVTKERTFELFAQTKAEKEMWVHAFNTILKYKRATKQHYQEGHDPDEEDKYIEGEAEGTSEEDEDLKNNQSDEDNNDFMEDNRQIKLRSKKLEDPEEQTFARHHHLGQPKLSKYQQEDDSDEDEGEEDQEQQQEYVNNRRDDIPQKKIKGGPKNQKQREQHNRHQEAKFQPEEIELPKAQPIRKKKRDDPEIIDDELPDSEDEQEQAYEKENKAVTKSKHPRNADDYSHGARHHQEDLSVDVDIDRIVKKGIVETIRLDPPSPPKQNEKNEEPKYFTGFNNNANRAHLKKKQPEKPEKPKKVVKSKNIKKNNDNNQEDLLSMWDRKYGNKVKESDGSVWDGNSTAQESQQTMNESKPAKTKKKKAKAKNAIPQYVENTLEDQPKVSKDEFEDNWDDDDDDDDPVPANQYYSLEKNQVRHPDIIPEKPAKKKKGKKKKNIPLNQAEVRAAFEKNGDNFEKDFD